MGWSGENFRKANIFINPPDTGYNPFTFGISNQMILVKILSYDYFPYELTNFGKILLFFSYKSIDIDIDSDFSYTNQQIFAKNPLTFPTCPYVLEKSPSCPYVA